MHHSSLHTCRRSCAVSFVFLITLCSIHGWLCRYGLQYFSSHEFQAPRRLLVLQQDHVDRGPNQTLSDSPTRSSKNPQQGAQTQPQAARVHFQLWSFLYLYFMSCLKIVHDLVKAPCCCLSPSPDSHFQCVYGTMQLNNSQEVPPKFRLPTGNNRHCPSPCLFLCSEFLCSSDSHFPCSRMWWLTCHFKLLIYNLYRHRGGPYNLLTVVVQRSAWITVLKRRTSTWTRRKQIRAGCEFVCNDTQVIKMTTDFNGTSR